MTIIDMKRLIAEEGMLISNGTIVGSCIDVMSDFVDEWQEIEKKIENEDLINE